MKSLILAGAALATAALYLSGYTLRPPGLQTFHRENVLGTSFELKAVASSPEAAGQAETAALDEIRREASILSSWDTQSEFSRWFRTRNQAVQVSPELFEVLSMFDRWRVQTGGALDPAAEAITRIWKTAEQQGRTPSQYELNRAIETTRHPHWSLDASKRTATHLDDTPLAMNSFVKSYIMDHAARSALRTRDVTAVVLNIGGDLVIRGAWTEPVAIADPRSDAENSAPAARVYVTGRAIATSGNYRRGFDIAGRHYSHIVDPRTGQPAGQILSATVISPNPAQAGALATAFCVLTPAESRRLAAKSPGTDFLLISATGERISSPGWKRYEAAPPVLSALAKPAPIAYFAPQAAPAAGAMDLTIAFDIAQVGGGARRPYVAVWIEDKDRFPVRTLALWYQKERWLPDLRSWYRDDRMRAMAEGNDITRSIASATRPPGKYKLEWDGKDNAGKPVKPGKYTVCIEAAREHGTYQVMRQELDLNGASRQFQIPGNEEISSASIDYRKAAH